MDQKMGCSEPYGYQNPKDDFGVFWQLKSTGIKIMGLMLMKVFDKKKKPFHNRSYNETNVKPQCLHKDKLGVRVVTSEKSVGKVSAL